MDGVEIEVRPARAKRGETVEVTVYGLSNYDPKTLLMQVVAAKCSAVMRPPRRLGTYASPRQDEPYAYVSAIETGSYEPGEYIVDVSSSEGFKPQYTVSKAFTVVPFRPAVRRTGTAGRR